MAVPHRQGVRVRGPYRGDQRAVIARLRSASCTGTGASGTGTGASGRARRILAGTGDAPSSHLADNRCQAGSGALYASGTATQLDVTLSGSGLAQLGNVVARNVRATVAGSGPIRVCPSKYRPAALLTSSRAASAQSPATWACRIASTGYSCAANQPAARLSSSTPALATDTKPYELLVPGSLLPLLTTGGDGLGRAKRPLP